MRTACRVFLEAPVVSAGARMNLGPGSTALMLAILGGSVEAVTVILDFAQKSPEIGRALLGAVNADGETALRFAIYASPGPVQETVLGNLAVLNAEFAGSRPLVLAATLGRARVLDLAESIESSDPGLVCRLCFDRDESGESVMECARKKVAFATLGTSAADKERCAARLRGMTIRAFNFAVRTGLIGLTRGKQYAELFEPFSRTPAEIMRGLARFVEK